MLDDICTLIDQGATDEQVAENLDLSPEVIPAIAYLRERGDEILEGVRGNRSQE
jgi:hypothetical protein